MPLVMIHPLQRPIAARPYGSPIGRYRCDPELVGRLRINLTFLRAQTRMTAQQVAAKAADHSEPL
jgi:hypothetical protein